jgi:hypothetical protein
MNRLALATALAAASFACACGGGSIPTPPPPTGNFTDANLKGQYAFFMSGQDAVTGGFIARVGSFTADGNRGITGGIEDVNSPINGPEKLLFTSSTYSVHADGRGVLNLSNATGTISFSITLLSPTEGLIVETDLNATTSGVFYLQDPNAFTTAGFSGNYAFDVTGIDFSQATSFLGGVPDSIIGQFASNGSNGLGGMLDENDNASSSGASPFTSGSYHLDANDGPTFGRGLMTFVANGITYNYIYYIVNSSRLYLMEDATTPTSPLTIGSAVAQNSVPITNATFNGNFAFLATGSGFSGSSGFTAITRIGRFNADGSGNLASLFADTNDNGVVDRVPNGSLSSTTYSIDTGFPGSGRGSLTFTDSKLGTFQFVFYLSSSSGGVIQDVSRDNVADGTLQLQTGAPFSNTSTAGDYGLNFSGLSNNSSTNAIAEEDFVGHIRLSSSTSNNVSGAVDFSEFSSNQGVFTDIVVSGNGLTVGGDGSTGNGTRNALSLKLNASPSSTLNLVPYFVNSQTMFVAGTDTNRVIAGTVRIQNP